MKIKRRFIDSHQHVYWHGRDDEGLVRDMDLCGVEKAWLLTWETSPLENTTRWHQFLNPLNMRSDGTHAGITLGDLVKARDNHPNRFELGYCPHPLVGDAAGLLRAAHGIHGAKICGEWKFRMLFDDPRCLQMFRTAGELGMPVVLHLDVPYLSGTYQEDWYGGTYENLERALKACPGTIFIGHAPGFWREISGDSAEVASPYPEGPVVPGGQLYRLLETYPNLYADLSAGSGRIALARDLEHAAKFLTAYSHRLLFARDYYGTELIEVLEQIDLSEDAWDRICFKNAKALLGEDDEPGSKNGPKPS